MVDINKLRRLAQAATPGPWVVYEVGVGFEIADGDNVIAQAQSIPRDSVQHTTRKSNAAFIAAANPAVIDEIIDRLEAAEKEIAAMKQQEPVGWLLDDEFSEVRQMSWFRDNEPIPGQTPLYALPGAQPAQSIPGGVAWPECPKRRQSHVLFDDGYEEGWAACLAAVKAMIAAAPECE